ncbi:hypothetical protein [Bauldia sp.]|uniref:hypothetical protein n=1 Tax=Bauldia sp. TaxID=2575872 RepID=UPI003BAA5197
MIRLFVSTVGALLLGVVVLTHANAQAEPDPSRLGDPDYLEQAIKIYNAWPEELLAKASGNIIGEFATLFRQNPDRVDSWLATMTDDRVRSFAVVALSLADDTPKAEAFAIESGLETGEVASVLFYFAGDSFPPPMDLSGQPIGPLLADLGTLDSMTQVTGWHQDVLWSAALIQRDGTPAIQILEQMDEYLLNVAEVLGPAILEFGPSSPEVQEDVKAFAQTDQGKPTGLILAMYVYISAGSWSFRSNSQQYDFVAEALDDYAAAHPDSAAVREVRRR